MGGVLTSDAAATASGVGSVPASTSTAGLSASGTCSEFAIPVAQPQMITAAKSAVLMYAVYHVTAKTATADLTSTVEPTALVWPVSLTCGWPVGFVSVEVARATT